MISRVSFHVSISSSPALIQKRIWSLYKVTSLLDARESCFILIPVLSHLKETHGPTQEAVVPIDLPDVLLKDSIAASTFLWSSPKRIWAEFATSILLFTPRDLSSLISFSNHSIEINFHCPRKVSFPVSADPGRLCQTNFFPSSETTVCPAFGQPTEDTRRS
jgi:hypothetical protein